MPTDVSNRCDLPVLFQFLVVLSLSSLCVLNASHIAWTLLVSPTFFQEKGLLQLRCERPVMRCQLVSSRHFFCKYHQLVEFLRCRKCDHYFQERDHHDAFPILTNRPPGTNQASVYGNEALHVLDVQHPDLGCPSVCVWTFGAMQSRPCSIFCETHLNDNKRQSPVFGCCVDVEVWVSGQQVARSCSVAGTPWIRFTDVTAVNS